MQWGGPVTVFDTMTQTEVTLRTFGAFEGTIAHPDGEAILKPMLLEAVRAAMVQKGGAVLSLANAQAQIAENAQASLAPRLQELGAVGQLTIAAISFSEEDRARLMAAAAKGAAAQREAIMARMAQGQNPAAPPQAAQAPAGFAIGAQVLVAWSDGHRYPGMVREAQPGQVLVAFQNGSQQWVPLQYVSQGS